MSGFFGVMTLGAPAAPAEIESLCRAMREAAVLCEGQNRDRIEVFRPRFGFILDVPAGVAAHASDHQENEIWVEGCPVASREYPSFKETRVKRAAALLALLRGGEAKALARINGSFNAVMYEPRRDSVRLLTDSMNLRPLYWAPYRGFLVFAPEIKCLAALPEFPLALNPVALFEALRFGFLFGDHTQFREIQRLPPAGELEAPRGGGRRLACHWTPPPPAPDSPGSEENDAAHELGDRIVTAAERCLRADAQPLLMLSGGLNSRTIALALAALGARPDCLTFGQRLNSEELHYAWEVARRFGFPHEIHSIVGVEQNRHAEQIAAAVDWQTAYFHAWDYAFRHLYEGRGAIYEGYLADLTLGGKFISPALLAARSPEEKTEAVRALFSANSLALDCGVFRPESARALDAEWRAGAASLLERIEPERAQADGLCLYVRSRRFTSHGFHCVYSYIDMQFPMLDRDLLDFLFAQPLDRRRNHALYLKMYEVHPVFRPGREIPCTSVTKFGGSLARSPFGAIALRARREISARFPGLGLPMRSHTHLPSLLRQGGHIQARLQERAFFQALEAIPGADPDAAFRFAAREIAAGFPHAPLVAHLMNLCFFCNRWFSGARTPR